MAETLQRTPDAVRAHLNKEGGLSRLVLGMRRERTVEHALTQVTLTKA
jgi:hypothetical protein